MHPDDDGQEGNEMGNGKRAAAGGAIAALTLGAADVGRNVLHDSGPATRIVEHVPAGSGGGIATELEHAAVTTATGRTLDHEASDSDDARDVMCSVFSYYDDVGSQDDASFDDFVEWAGDEINHTSSKKTEDIYDDVTDLASGDWTALANTYCDTQ